MAVAGKNGKVVVGSGAEEKVVGIKSWSLELSLETLETTALGILKDPEKLRESWNKVYQGTRKPIGKEKPRN